MTLITRNFLITYLLSARMKVCVSRGTSRITQISIFTQSRKYLVPSHCMEVFKGTLKEWYYFVIDRELHKTNKPRSTLVITRNQPGRMPLRYKKMKKLSIQKIIINLSWLHHFASISSRKDIDKIEAALWRLMIFTVRNWINYRIWPWNRHEVIIMSHFFIITV